MKAGEVRDLTTDELKDKLSAGAGVMGTERFRRRAATPDRGTQVSRSFVDPELEAYFLSLEHEPAVPEAPGPSQKRKKKSRSTPPTLRRSTVDWPRRATSAV